jgi:hypothetical protein
MRRLVLQLRHDAAFQQPAIISSIPTVASEIGFRPNTLFFKGRPRFLTLALTNSLTELSQAHTGV